MVAADSAAHVLTGGTVVAGSAVAGTAVAALTVAAAVTLVAIPGAGGPFPPATAPASLRHI